jgi:Xaa-Pro aminopeptidase
MTYGMMATDVEQRIDFDAMRKYKLARMQEQLAAKNLGAVLCFDPDNIRYVTTTHLAEWARDKMVRWCVLPRGGEPVLFEVGTAAEAKRLLCPWLKRGNIRPSRPWARGAIDPAVVAQQATAAARDIRAVLQENHVTDMPVGIDIMDFYILQALQAADIKVVNGWDAMWDARTIKCKQELQIIELSAALVDGVYGHLVDWIKPGVLESELVARICEWLLARGCDHITGVNCISGPRANPHPHDYSDRMLRPADLVYIDIITSYLGYSTCYYRTFAVTTATARQRDVYKRAMDWLQASIDVVRPGITTADIAAKWPTAKELGFADEAHALGLAVGHGLGLSNHEKPFITRAFSMTKPEPIEAGMHFALETFCGDGDEGARIESQVIVTESGHKVITKWPCEELMVCNPRGF